MHHEDWSLMLVQVSKDFTPITTRQLESMILTLRLRVCHLGKITILPGTGAFWRLCMRVLRSTPITTRQLESMIRLAQARAKAELRVTVTAQDAQDVVLMMQARAQHPAAVTYLMIIAFLAHASDFGATPCFRMKTASKCNYWANRRTARCRHSAGRAGCHAHAFVSWMWPSTARPLRRPFLKPSKFSSCISHSGT
jgi:MCM AAA-lid domain